MGFVKNEIVVVLFLLIFLSLYDYTDVSVSLSFASTTDSAATFSVTFILRISGEIIFLLLFRYVPAFVAIG